jgi:16S rRNA (cytidine1402-2'-O)-methyltransferase
VFEILRNLEIFIVENTKTARRYLRKAGFEKPFDNVIFYEIDKHTEDQNFEPCIHSLLEGKAVGLLSEAGTPCIADPGAAFVKVCQQNNIPVFPLVGPSSILLALMGSGFNGQNFAFHGYLPIENIALKRRIKAIEQAVYQSDQTQIFIETPYRNQKLFETLLKNCAPDTELCLASELTTQNELIKTKSIAKWQKSKVDLNKRPTVFLLYK